MTGRREKGRAENAARNMPGTLARIGRVLWGLVFLASGVVNLIVTLPNPAFYEVFAELTFFPFFRWLIVNVAIPNAQLITALVAVFELAAGVLIMGRGRAVTIGLIGTMLWVVFITPAMGWYTIFAPVLLVIPGLLLRSRFPRSVVGVVVRRGEG
jgi:hypothetical protein